MGSSQLKGSPDDPVGFKRMHYLSWAWKQAWETVLKLEGEVGGDDAGRHKSSTLQSINRFCSAK